MAMMAIFTGELVQGVLNINISISAVHMQMVSLGHHQ